MASIPASASTTAAAAAAATAASRMQTVTLSLLTHASLSPKLAQSLSSLATPSIAVATNAATTASRPPPDQDFDMGSLPWPPLWLTVCAFALTLVATVMGVGVWLISSPPRYAGCDGGDDCVCRGEEDGGQEKEWCEGKGDEEELEEEWDGDDEDDDAVELKGLLSGTPQKLNDSRRVGTVANRNSKNLRLDLTAVAGLDVGSWGRVDPGGDGINNDVDHEVWERKCRDYGVERHHHDNDDDETASLVSLSIASCSSSSSSTANRIPNARTPNGRSAASKSTKPVFNQPLRGWRKAVDDRVCALACWIEAYVADGGREKDLLYKITREERGDVVYGFEY